MCINQGFLSNHSMQAGSITVIQEMFRSSRHFECAPNTPVESISLVETFEIGVGTHFKHRVCCSLLIIIIASSHVISATLAQDRFFLNITQPIKGFGF